MRVPMNTSKQNRGLRGLYKAYFVLVCFALCGARAPVAALQALAARAPCAAACHRHVLCPPCVSNTRCAAGPFSPAAEIINGRAAMLGFLLLVFIETNAGVPFF